MSCCNSSERSQRQSSHCIIPADTTAAQRPKCKQMEHLRRRDHVSEHIVRTPAQNKRTAGPAWHQFAIKEASTCPTSAETRTGSVHSNERNSTANVLFGGPGSSTTSMTPPLPGKMQAWGQTRRVRGWTSSGTVQAGPRTAPWQSQMLH